jgi:hypothetical protein
MRPAGEIRSAICDALMSHGPMPLVDLMGCVGLQTTPKTIENTVKNAVRSGLLEKVGHEKREHCHKWVAVYDVANNVRVIEPGNSSGIVVLAGYLRDWC